MYGLLCVIFFILDPKIWYRKTKIYTLSNTIGGTQSESL